MRKALLYFLVVFLLVAGVEKGINYVIKHQEDLRFEAIKMNSDNYIELILPAETISKIFAAKEKMGASEIRALPLNGGKWKVLIFYNNKKEGKVGFKGKRERASNPRHLTGEELQHIKKLQKNKALSKRDKSGRDSLRERVSDKKLFATKPVRLEKRIASRSFKPLPRPSIKVDHNKRNNSSRKSFKKEMKREVLPSRYSPLNEKARKALLEKVSVSYKGLPLTAFLDIVSEKLDVSVVTVGSTPRVFITFFAKKTEFYKIVETVLDVNGMAFLVESENLILVGRTQDILNLRKQKEALARLQRIGPEKVVVIRVRNMKASDVGRIVKSSVGKEELEYSAINETGTLILRGPQKLVDLALGIVDKIDRARAQIQISAKIVEVSSSETHRLGIRWSAYGTLPPGTAGMQTGISTYPALPTPDGTKATANFPVPERSIAQNLKIGLPYNLAGLELQLSALERRGKARTIAEPSIVLEEGQKGLLWQVREVPYTTTNTSWVSSVSFKQAGLQIDVTPYIVDPEKNLVRLNIQLENSSVDFDRQVLGQPTIVRQKMQVINVMKSGEIRIIGGLKKEVSSRSGEHVPLISRLPILGALFSSRDHRREVMELIVFIRASILNAKA